MLNYPTQPNIRRGKGQFHPAGRTYGDDHVLVLGAVPAELPSDREKLIVTTTGLVSFTHIRPSVDGRELILENGNPVESERPIVFRHFNQGGTIFGNLNLGSPDAEEEALYPLENMTFRYDARSGKWELISAPLEADGGSFV